MNRLVDSSAMTDIDITYAQMRNIRANEKAPGHPPTASICTVFISPDDISFGMAHVYRSIGSPAGTERVHMVDDLKETMAILGIDPIHTDRLKRT